MTFLIYRLFTRTRWLFPHIPSVQSFPNFAANLINIIESTKFFIKKGKSKEKFNIPAGLRSVLAVVDNSVSGHAGGAESSAGGWVVAPTGVEKGSSRTYDADFVSYYDIETYGILVA